MQGVPAVLKQALAASFCALQAWFDQNLPSATENWVSSKQLSTGFWGSWMFSRKHQPFSNSSIPWSARGGTQPPLGFPSSPLETWLSAHLHPFISWGALPSGQRGATFWLVSEGVSSRITFKGPFWRRPSRDGAEVPLIHSPSTLNKNPSLHSKFVPGHPSSQSSHVFLITSPSSSTCSHSLMSCYSTSLSYLSSTPRSSIVRPCVGTLVVSLPLVCEREDTLLAVHCLALALP